MDISFNIEVTETIYFYRGQKHSYGGNRVYPLYRPMKISFCHTDQTSPTNNDKHAFPTFVHIGKQTSVTATQ